MENANTLATNVLIIGEAGIGKSNFIYKLINNDEIVNKHYIYPVVIDYREAAPKKISGCILNFIHKMVEYFENISQPINTITRIEENSIDHNIQSIYKHLEKIPKKNVTRHLVVFLDDFDYLEDEWYKLLDYFLPFAASDKVSLILSVRPPLFEAINHYDDRFNYYYVRNVHTIELEPLEVSNVISTRLAPILTENKRHPFHSYIQRLFNRDTSICKIIEKLGIRDIDDLPRIEYPMTNKHNIFMRRITNGNLREIFDIAYESLMYIFDNYDKLESRLEDNILRKVIGREGVMKIFYDNPKSSYKIINLHKYKLRENSLLYNVIEAVKIREYIDERFYKDLKSFGHSEGKVNWALNYLMDKNNRFIYPKRLLPKKIDKKNNLYPELKITEKANFYLQLSDWDEYIERCGKYGESFIKKEQI